jgi:hypothetical protein
LSSSGTLPAGTGARNEVEEGGAFTYFCSAAAACIDDDRVKAVPRAVTGCRHRVP